MGLLGGDGSGRCCVRLATEHPEAPFHDLLCLSLFANFQDMHFQMGKLRLGEVRSLPRFTHCKLLDLPGSAVWTPTVTATFLSRLLTGLGVKQRDLGGSEGSQAQPLSPENPERQAGSWPGDITRRPR